MLSDKVIFNQQTQFEGYIIIGYHTYILDSYISRYSIVTSNSKLNNDIVGRFCCLGQNIQAINALHTTRGLVSTHPAFLMTEK